MIVAKTHHHIIIALYDSTMYASIASEAVEKLGTNI
jgi:Profilin